MRSFLALTPPEDVRDAMVRVQAMLPAGRPVVRENLHLTLAFLDDQPEDLLEDLHIGLTGLRMPAMDIAFRGLGAFGGDKPRLIFAEVQPCPALAEMRQAVLRCVQRAGIRLRKERYHPHVTLARLKGDPSPAMVSFLSEYAGTVLPGWTAIGLSLCQSTLRPDGPVYEELASYPLG